MIHELLMALHGVPGDVFLLCEGTPHPACGTEHAATDECGQLHIPQDLPFVTHGERQMMNELARLGYSYRQLDEFCRHYSVQQHVPHLCDPRMGQYLSSLAVGVNEELQTYRDTLCNVQQELLDDAGLTLSHVRHVVEPFRRLLPALWRVVHHLHSHQIRGCLIPDYLYRAVQHNVGVPSLHAALTRLLHRCHRIFYWQLTSWMLRGRLVDPKDEFFVKPVFLVRPATENSEVKKDPPVAFMDGQSLQQMRRGHGERENNSATMEDYVLRGEMLPSYISCDTASKVLFVGQAVHLFQSARDQVQISRRLVVPEPNALTEPGDDYKPKYAPFVAHSIVQDLEERFLPSLQRLMKEDADDGQENLSPTEFQPLHLSEQVREIHRYVTERVWELFVDEHHLLEHLEHVKHIFLMTHGELFELFISRLTPLLVNAPQRVSSLTYDVNLLFRQAHAALYLDEEKVAETFHYVAEQPSETLVEHWSSREGVYQMREQGWAWLRLDYRVPWPFYIMFPECVMRKYNHVHQFLFLVRRTQMRLKQCWKLQTMSHKRPRQQQTGKTNSVVRIDSPQWTLRSHMAFVVDHLMAYLYRNVIDSRYRDLVQEVRHVHDVEKIVLAHDIFITSVCAQAFLYHEPIRDCLEKLLALCLNFTDLLLKSASDGMATDSEAVLTRVVQMQQHFQNLSKLLFDVWNDSSPQLQTCPYLKELLLALDFNFYYSTRGGRLGVQTLDV